MTFENKNIIYLNWVMKLENFKNKIWFKHGIWIYNPNWYLKHYIWISLIIVIIH